MTRPVHIGPLEIGSTTRVVGTLSSPDSLLDSASILESLSSSCDIAELRLDLLGQEDWQERCTVIRKVVPCLATIRSKEEGGAWLGGEPERLAAYREIIPLVDAIDIELECHISGELVELGAAAGIPVVLSHHDFEGTPSTEKIRDLLHRMEAMGPSVIAKVALLVSDSQILAELEQVLNEQWAIPVCLLGMGPLAKESRVRFAGQGSALTYGYLDLANAPGQPSAADLKQLLG